MSTVLPGHAFVGRADELARLTGALERARERGAVAIVVGGEAGVGKTRLIDAFAWRARDQGATILSGACIELSSLAPPYGPFIEALRELVRLVEPARLPALLGPWRVELGRLLPELEASVPTAAPSEFDRSAQARLFEIVLGVLERMAHTAPLVLIIEDLHWSDRSTRDLLAFLVRNLRREPVVFVVSVRTDELAANHPVLPFLAELERDERVERLELAPFGSAEIRDLLVALQPEPPSADRVDEVLRRTDGNPFFVEQLVQATGDPGASSSTDPLPPRLQDVLRGRIATVSDDARDVLRAASAAGRRTDDSLLAEVLEMPGRAVARALRELIGRGFIEPAGPAGAPASGYGFHHALLREVVYGELLLGERRRLHAAFAAALAERGEVAGLPVVAADLAYHWDAAGDWARALPVLIEAGRQAEAVYAFGAAAASYERALELWDRVADAERAAGTDRVTLLQRTAEVNVLIGQHQQAIALGRAALDALGDRAGAEPLRAGHLHDRLRWFLWDAGDRDGAAKALRDALDVLPLSPPTTTRARALAQLAGVELHAGRFAEAASAARIAIEAARAAGGRGEEALAIGVLGWATAVSGEPDAGIAIYRDGLRIAEELRGVEGIALGYAESARLLDTLGRSEASLDAARDGFEIVRRLGLERTYGGIILGHQANALYELGRWHEDRAVLDQAERLGPVGRPALWLAINAARLATGQGRYDVAAAALERARSLHGDLHGSEFGPSLLVASGEFAATHSRVDDVRRLWDTAVAGIQPGALPDRALLWLALLALRTEADRAEHARVRRDDDALATALERAAAIGAAISASIEGSPTGIDDLRLEAILATSDAEMRRASATDDRDAWLTAASAWESAGRPYPAAYAWLRFAEITVAVRSDRKQAERAMREAHRTAVRLGADPLRATLEELARRARLDLDAGSEGTHGAPTAADAGPDLGLTAREREVLTLVAGGWTNQQIADRLFISRKTASVHVSNVLGKLGVQRREEAAAVAHRIGIGRHAPTPPGSEPVA